MRARAGACVDRGASCTAVTSMRPMWHVDFGAALRVARARRATRCGECRRQALRRACVAAAWARRAVARAGPDSGRAAALSAGRVRTRRLGSSRWRRSRRGDLRRCAPVARESAVTWSGGGGSSGRRAALIRARLAGRGCGSSGSARPRTPAPARTSRLRPEPAAERTPSAGAVHGSRSQAVPRRAGSSSRGCAGRLLRRAIRQRIRSSQRRRDPLAARARVDAGDRSCAAPSRDRPRGAAG